MQSFRGRNFPKRLLNNRALAQLRRMAEGKASEQGTAEGEGAELPPWDCMLRLWRNGRQAKGCEVGRMGHQFRAWRDFGADIVASTKGRFLDISYCQSY